MVELKDENLNHTISYQSRVGPLKWIGPSTDDEIIKYSKEKKGIVIVPVAFVSEHSETLVELDIEYKKLAKENGINTFQQTYINWSTLSLGNVHLNHIIININTIAFDINQNIPQ